MHRQLSFPISPNSANYFYSRDRLKKLRKQKANYHLSGIAHKKTVVISTRTSKGIDLARQNSTGGHPCSLRYSKGVRRFWNFARKLSGV